MGGWHFATHVLSMPSQAPILQPMLPAPPSFSSITVGLAMVHVGPPRTAGPFAAAPAHRGQGRLVKARSRGCRNPQTTRLMETFPQFFSVQRRRLLRRSLLQSKGIPFKRPSAFVFLCLSLDFRLAEIKVSVSHPWHPRTHTHPPTHCKGAVGSEPPSPLTPRGGLRTSCLSADISTSVRICVSTVA